MSHGGGGRAVTRTAQLLAVFVGTGGLVFAATFLPQWHVQSAAAPLWWTAGATAVLVGGPVSLAAAGLPRRTTAGTLRRLAGAWAVAVLAVLASYPLVVVAPLPGGTAPWIGAFVGTAACAAALAWRIGPALLYLAAGAALWGVVRWVGTDGAATLVAVQDAAYSAAFGLALVTLVWVVTRSALDVDHVAAAAAAAAMVLARRDARERERERVATFAHDGVLATIRSASQGGAGSTEAVRREARRALDDLDELRRPTPGNGEVSAAELLTRLELRAALAGHGTPVDAEVVETVLPEPVAATIAAATAEALSNSVRHAGDVYRAMAVTVGPGMVEVEVRDDGPGFDPDRVGADRLGVSGSIVGRMSRLPGGYARVLSGHGRGTTVVLGWRG